MSGLCVAGLEGKQKLQTRTGSEARRSKWCSMAMKGLDVGDRKYRKVKSEDRVQTPDCRYHGLPLTPDLLPVSSFPVLATAPDGSCETLCPRSAKESRQEAEERHRVLQHLTRARRKHPRETQTCERVRPGECGPQRPKQGSVSRRAGRRQGHSR